MRGLTVFFSLHVIEKDKPLNTDIISKHNNNNDKPLIISIIVIDCCGGA